MKNKLYCSILLASAATGGSLPLPALAQERSVSFLEEIVVTARRREERLQDVPVSMTIFNQAQLDERNIVSATDLALYTPSMAANTRFGNDFSTFSIRGFHQELRTTASVGVYFAEVVAPRGANTTTSGDGAGPGDLFDLENVQVLKGPQGTLFGRNTTGGAVLLVPRKPTDEFEGYIEGSVGNYDMRRVQGVLNVPLHDRVRLRLGLDYQERDGHIKNLTEIGPRRFGDVDYIAGRISLVADLADNLENYTIFKIVSSENNGTPGQTFACDPSAENLGAFFVGPCAAMLASDPRSTKYYHTFNTILDPTNELDQWQLINTTTWAVSDNITVKNILSFSHLETVNRNSTFGTNLQFPLPAFPGMIPGIAPGGLGSQEIIFAHTGSGSSYPTTSQESFVEELQFQGVHFDGGLTWQAGLYYEKSKPDGLAGSLSPSYISCLPETTFGPPSGFMCNDLLAAFLPFEYWGLIQSQAYGVTYETRAVYGQATYEINDQFSITGGLRYTDDRTKGYAKDILYRFPSNPATGGYFPVLDTQDNETRSHSRSKKPTWLVGLDYKPNTDTLLYAKYSRGYRQAGLNMAAPEGLQDYEAEKVDTYEIGAKTSFYGRFPGNFNIAAFYNDFSNQAIQVGVLPPGAAGTTVIGNIGKSTLWGIELDGTVQLFDGFTASVSYAYLDTKVDSFLNPQDDPRYDNFRATGGIVSNVNAVEGEPLPFAPEHSVTLSMNYRLPLPESIGDVDVGGTYIYTAKQQTTSPTFSPFGVMPSYEIVNLHLNWKGVAGSPFDVSLFASNVFNEKYLNFVSGNWDAIGFETRYAGQPRMYGARLRYNF